MRRMDNAATSYLLSCPENNGFAITYGMSTRGWKTDLVKALQTGLVTKYFKVRSRTFHIDHDLLYDVDFGTIAGESITINEIQVTHTIPLALILAPHALEMLLGAAQHQGIIHGGLIDSPW